MSSQPQPPSPTNPLKCVHKGCGKTYTDPRETCVYHPGPPEFHEGQKGWMCCKPRVLTFDEFLAIEGCTRGLHSNVDDTPAQWAKKDNAATTGSTEKGEPSKDRTDADGEVRKTRPIAISEKVVGNSLAAAMAAPAPAPNRNGATTPQQSLQALEEDSDEEGIENTLSEGATCQRRSCGKTYTKSTPRTQEKCVYHPGVPLFHEGSKGWTCCKRRVLEFEEFLKIEGCKERTGHCYVGKKKKSREKDNNNNNNQQLDGVDGDDLLKDEDVRSDFYQTASSVIASFYLKKIVKDRAVVQFDAEDRRTVSLDLPTANGKRYRSAIQVWGEIEPSQCKYRVLGTKLEVTLVKAGEGAVGWPVLRLRDRDTGERIQVGRAGRA